MPGDRNAHFPSSFHVLRLWKTPVCNAFNSTITQVVKFASVSHFNVLVISRTALNLS